MMTSIGFCEQSNHFVVRLAYENRDVMDDVPQRKWNRSTKNWEVPGTIQDFEHLAEALGKRGMEFTISDIAKSHKERLHSQSIQQTANAITGLRPKVNPYKHQKDGFEFLAKKHRGALLWEMGTGKTAVASWFLDALFYGSCARSALVVAPNSVKGNWVVELQKHSWIPADRIFLLDGQRPERLQTLQRAKAATCPVVVVNYEGVLTLFEELTSFGFGAIVADESTFIKSITAKRSKAMIKLGEKVEWKAILTGTPYTNSPLDIYTQLKFLDASYIPESYHSFKSRYCIPNPRIPNAIVGYRSLEHLRERLVPHVSRKLKSECLDLPEKTYETRQIEQTPEQKRIYRELTQEFLCFLEEQGKEGATLSITAPMILTRLVRLSQVASGFVKTDQGEIVPVPSGKMAELENVLDEIEGQKVIIWCHFRYEMSCIEALLKKKGMKFVQIHGDVPPPDRTEANKQFQEDPRVQVFLGQVQTAGMGLTLTAAANVVYYSNTFSLSDRLQSEDRCHRIGQNKAVTYVDIVVSKTIDEKIVQALRKKQSMVDILTGDGLKEMMRE